MPKASLPTKPSSQETSYGPTRPARDRSDSQNSSPEPLDFHRSPEAELTRERLQWSPRLDNEARARQGSHAYPPE